MKYRVTQSIVAKKYQAKGLLRVYCTIFPTIPNTEIELNVNYFVTNVTADQFVLCFISERTARLLPKTINAKTSIYYLCLYPIPHSLLLLVLVICSQSKYQSPVAHPTPSPYQQLLLSRVQKIRCTIY